MEFWEFHYFFRIFTYNGDESFFPVLLKFTEKMDHRKFRKIVQIVQRFFWVRNFRGLIFWGFDFAWYVFFGYNETCLGRAPCHIYLKSTLPGIGCRWWDSNSQPLGYKPSVLAIELNSSKAIAGKELSLSSWCIASLYIYHFSTVFDFSFEKYNSSCISQCA